MTEKVTISNAGGTVTCDAIDWRESQVCIPSIGDVPTRATGQYVDTGVWVLKTRQLKIRTRLSNAEKTTLLAIFNQVAIVTIVGNVGTLMNWTYYGWFRDKDIVYEYSKETALEPWRCDLIFDIYSFNYIACTCPSGEQITNGTFETGDFTGWTTEGTPIIGSNGGQGGSTKYAVFDESVTDKISQTLNNVSVDCITSFKVYSKSSGCVTPDIKVKIYYADGTNETYSDTAGTTSWKEHNILSTLDSGKCVLKVEIWFEWSGYCTAYCDTVTLVGTV